MRLDHPSREVMDAVRSAVAWFDRSRISGIRIAAVRAPSLTHGFDKRVVPAPDAGPLWARYYEIGSNRPIFGGRDTRILYSLAEVEPERRAGYRWYTDRPRRLLEIDFPAWSRRWFVSRDKTTPTASTNTQ